MKRLERWMFKILLATVVIVLPFIGPSFSAAQRVSFDSGPITLISEEKVTVVGNLGTHVLEPIGDCTWCEVGLEVLIEFRDLTRAVIKPHDESSVARPIRAFIVVDGRPD